MSTTTIGGYLAKRIEELGIRDYFAIPGDFNLALLDEMLKNPNLKMINCCNELNLGYAADGYARANGISAMIVTFSVGSLSTINAIAGAYAEYLPVIVVSGGPNINSIAKNHVLHHTLGKTDDRQEYVRNMFTSVTSHTVIIDNSHCAACEIDYALMQAVKTRKPVYIEIACNLSTLKISNPNPLNFFLNSRSDPASLKAAIEHTAEFLNAAKHPVLVAGGRLRSTNGIEALQKLADASEYGVACMPNAKGFFSEAYSRFVGIYWGSVSSPACREVVESSDAYLFAGPIFSDYTSVGFTALLRPEKLVEVGPDSVKLQRQCYNNILMPEFLEGLASKVKKNSNSYATFSQIQGEAEAQPEEGLSS